MTLKKKVIIYIMGVFVLTITVPLLVHSNVGTSPITSLVMSLVESTKLSFGTIFFCLNTMFALFHLLIFKNIRFAICALLSALIQNILMDVVRAVIIFIPNDQIIIQIITFILSFSGFVFGVALTQKAQVQKMPFEGFQAVLAKLFKKDINFVRVFLEISLVLISTFIFIITKNNMFTYINIGTLFIMLATGPSVHFVHKYLLKG